ncbi:hypothetical protein KP509_37G018300 [Ceratopteris richardii]|uniref:Small auxin up regulated protein n=1 Tax=Ceratopteris richardii TaxID=49495 RepID=A0A8T2Q5W5_CERRI|nr:hypothetical protein KP509_37G018300 [Ceratopteris richardii]
MQNSRLRSSSSILSFRFRDWPRLILISLRQFLIQRFSAQYFSSKANSIISMPLMITKRMKRNKSKNVPKGCIPILVNGNHRLIITIDTLCHHPLLHSMLQQAAEEGRNTFNYRGPLRLCCDADSFQELLQLNIPA